MRGQSGCSFARSANRSCSASEDADVLIALARRREVQVTEPLVAPLSLRGEPDDEVGGHDQAMPLPPARVPLAFARDGDADHRFGQEQEARDHRRREQVRVVAEDDPVPRRAHGVDDGPDDRDRRDQHVPSRFAARAAERRQLRDRPREPDGHRAQHRAHEQADRDCNLEAGVLLREEDVLRVESHEAAGGHERKREQQDARVSAPVGRLAGCVAEDERDAADEPEDHEVRAVVFEMRVELRATQQRREPDERERGRDTGVNAGRVDQKTAPTASRNAPRASRSSRASNDSPKGP
jgi:hypothetical protein